MSKLAIYFELCSIVMPVLNVMFIKYVVSIDTYNAIMQKGQKAKNKNKTGVHLKN